MISSLHNVNETRYEIKSKRISQKVKYEEEKDPNKRWA